MHHYENSLLFYTDLVGQSNKEVSINEEANKVHQAISEEFSVFSKDFECTDVANHVNSEELKKDTIGTFFIDFK